MALEEKEIISNTHEMNFTTMTPLRCYESANEGYNICVNWKNSITGLFKE